MVYHEFMDILRGTVLCYKKHPPLKILGKEPWFSEPVAICSVLGKYTPHHERIKHYEHFAGSHDVNHWLRDQHIITRDDVPAFHETLTFGDGLVSLIMAAEKVSATRAYIRSISYGSDPVIVPGDTSSRHQIIATIYAALYR